MLHIIKVNKSYPITGRTASQAVIGSLNFSILNQAARAIRQSVYGVPVDNAEEPSIDKFNEEGADQEAQTENARVVHELGFANAMEGPELARLLKSVRDSIAADLEKNCGYVNMAGVTTPDPRTLGQTMQSSFASQLKMQPKTSEADIKASAALLRLSEEAVRASIAASQKQQSNRFLTSKSEDILAWVEALDSNPEDAESALEALPAVVRLRLYTAADKALVKLWDRQVSDFTNHRRQEDALATIGLIEGDRRLLWEELDMMLAGSAFMNEVNEAAERGTVVNFAARPAPAVAPSKVTA